MSSGYVEEPSKLAPGNLDPIIQAASSIVIESSKEVVRHEEGQRRAAGAQEEARRAQGSAEYEVYSNIAVEALTGGVGRAISDGLTILDDRMDHGADLDKISKVNPLIPSSARSLHDATSFPLTDRMANVGDALTGKCGSSKERHAMKTQELQGKESIQETYTSRLLSENKLKQALDIKRDLAQQPRHAMPTLGGAAPRVAMAPKAPDFNTSEESTNWAGMPTG